MLEAANNPLAVAQRAGAPQTPGPSRFATTSKGLHDFWKWACKKAELGQPPETDWLVGLEPTAPHHELLLEFLVAHKLCVWMLRPGDITRSLAGQKEKSDQRDAECIADYVYRYQDEAIRYVPPCPEVAQLKILLSRRKNLVTHREAIMVPIRMRAEALPDNKEAEADLAHFKALEKAINAEIKAIEQEITKCIQAKKSLRESYALLTQIPGVGLVLTSYFLTLVEGGIPCANARALASYGGIAPFRRESGSSVHKGCHCALGDRELKRLLHMASVSTIASKKDNPFKSYYLRLKERERPGLVALNNLRNKLFRVMFAVYKSGKLYDPKMVEAGRKAA